MPNPKGQQQNTTINTQRASLLLPKPAAQSFFLKEEKVTIHKLPQELQELMPVKARGHCVTLEKILSALEQSQLITRHPVRLEHNWLC